MLENIINEKNIIKEMVIGDKKQDKCDWEQM
jgi:hypothetical protein